MRCPKDIGLGHQAPSPGACGSILSFGIAGYPTGEVMNMNLSCSVAEKGECLKGKGCLAVWKRKDFVEGHIH
ncbi:unnamed protein product [Menidia menidia]|uniref:(Atlantic silverside) hypothetical protein n=1 Tax=Menidia menidia TaxID=238744 RepID=A0A8S4AUA6_9TELE|nr:unnamed protein product [Menidia menidia]